MGMLRKPDPEKYCAFCERRMARKRQRNGALESLQNFDRRKFCDRMCMAGGMASRPKTANPSWMTAHYHARNLVPPGPCRTCGTPDASDVHHVNEDWQDNEPSNLLRLCRSCHMKRHRTRGACSVCGKPQKGHGYCEKHYQRWKKWGDPLLVKDNQFTELRTSD